VTVAPRLEQLLGVPVGSDAGTATAQVPRGEWVAAVTAVRDELDGGFFDVLLGVDLLERGFEVVVRLWSVTGRYGVQLRTGCPRDDARVPSLAGVFAGASWHERETAEMLGIAFDGHPWPAPLLLPEGSGHPLRKEAVLTARLEQQWPGAVEPGQSEPNPRRVPPGGPAPGRSR
jgi:NADH-quinone oxidoreductase subunit C